MTVLDDSMDASLGVVDAGEAGRRYLAARLSDGGVLPRSIVGQEHAALSTARAVAPIDWTPSRGFDSGGVAAYSMARQYLFELLKGMTIDIPHSAIVTRHGLALPTDPVLQDRRTACFFCGDEVYRFVREPIEDVDVAALWNESETPVYFSFAVVRWPSELAQVRHGSTLSAADLDVLARAAGLVGVNVFDGESYLFAELRPRGRSVHS